MRLPLHRGLAVGMALLLSGCASLNPMTLVKLLSIDLLKTEPGVMAVAAVAPRELMLRTGDVRMELKLKSDDGAINIHETVYLEVAEMPGTLDIAYDRESQRVTMARVPRADFERLADAQKRGRAFRASGRKDGKGSLSIGVIDGCHSGELPQGELPVSIYIRTEAGGDFLPVLSNVDLRQVENGTVAARIRPCATASH